MTKEWIKYNPKVRETKYDTKMSLRNMIGNQHLLSLPVPIEFAQRSDRLGDEYIMELDGERISIKANEKGQEEGKPGIFFFAEHKDKTKIEEILMEIFG